MPLAYHCLLNQMKIRRSYLVKTFFCSQVFVIQYRVSIRVILMVTNTSRVTSEAKNILATNVATFSRERIICTSIWNFSVARCQDSVALTVRIAQDTRRTLDLTYVECIITKECTSWILSTINPRTTRCDNCIAITKSEGRQEDSLTYEQSFYFFFYLLFFFICVKIV